MTDFRLPHLTLPSKDERKLLGPVFSSFDQIVKDTKKMSVEIKKDMGKIDYQIGILRGGYTISILLSKFLNPSKNLLCDVSFYRKNPRSFYTDGALESLNSLKGNNVLVVDDLVSCGQTANYVLKELSCKNPDKIIMCTLVDKVCHRKPQYSIVNELLKYKVYTLQTEKFLVGFGMHWPTLPMHFRFFKNIYEYRETPESYVRLRKHA